MKLLRCTTLILTIAILSIALMGCNASLPKEETLSKMLEDGGYSLVFADEFEGDKLDTSTWINGYPTESRSAAYYVEDAVSVHDGNMVITTDYRKDGALGEGWYTGWIETMDSTSFIMETTNPHVTSDHKGFSQKYGYFEARCKLPKGVGLWAAFWLMPCKQVPGMTWHDDIKGTATDGVEIDVMESFNYGTFPNRNLNTHVIHMDGYKEDLKSIKSPLINVGSDIYDEFHTYGVMWTDKEYIFFIDGKESWRFDGNYEGKSYGVSEVEECLLLTCEVPGMDVAHPGKMKNDKGKLETHWSGDVMTNDLGAKYEFVVDYVRVYQR